MRFLLLEEGEGRGCVLRLDLEADNANTPKKVLDTDFLVLLLLCSFLLAIASGGL